MQRKTMLTLLTVLAAASLAVSGAACGSVEGSYNSNNSQPIDLCPEVTHECDTAGDADFDGISNGDEGCECFLDSDGDSLPNFQDRDSDGDGVSDEYERYPADTDGDGIPDWIDRDSDGDGVEDGDEDRNNDGRLGTCEDDAVACSGGSCADAESYCHPGLSICINALCLDGETDPTRVDTDGDGINDGDESTFICNAADEFGQGRKPILLQEHSRGLFQIAIEPDAVYTQTDPTSPGTDEGAGAFDMTDPAHASAGFVVSTTAGAATLYDDLSAMILALRSTFTGVTTLSSGNATQSHALKEQFVNVTLRVQPGSTAHPGQVRDQVMAALMGRPLTDFPNLPASPFTTTAAEFVVTLMVQRTDTTRNVFMGGVATFGDWQDKDDVAFHVSDAAGGACLASTADTTENECEQYLATIPTADILWVVDASGSMSDDQQRLSEASHSFLDVAATFGLQWRMCVVDMTRENAGSCCTDTNESGDRWLSAGNPGDDQRFRNCVQDPAGTQMSSGSRENGLTQMEVAINRHLPETQDSDLYYRPESAKVVIFLTDETADEAGQTDGCPSVIPNGPDDCHFFTGCAEHDLASCTSVMFDINLATTCEAFSGDIWSHPECSEYYRCMGDMNESAWDPILCDPIVAPYRQILDDNDMIAYGLAILATDPESCSPDSGISPPMGYKQLIEQTGGILASMCQSDLELTMQLIIEDIAGAASPLYLHHTPIPVSLAAAVERKDPANGTSLGYEAIPRSRTDGFNYKASTNRIVLVGQPMGYPPYEVVVSYTRWITPVVGPD